MAEDWAAAADDLEKLLDFDDFEVPAVFRSSRTTPCHHTKEAETEPLPGESPCLNPSSCHPLPNTEIVEDISHSREDLEPDQSGVVASVGGTLLIESPECTFSADTALIRPRTSQLNTQFVVARATGDQNGSFAERHGRGTAEGRDVHTQSIPLLSYRQNPYGTPTRDKYRRGDASLAAENSTISQVRRGVNDAAVVGKLGTRRAADDVEISCPQFTGIRESRKTCAISKAEDEDSEMGIVLGTGLAEESFVASKRKLSGQMRQSGIHVQQQGAGKVLSRSRETGTAPPVENRFNSLKNVGTSVERTQVPSLRDFPAPMPPSPEKEDCSKRIQQQESWFSEGGKFGGLPYRIPGPAGALQENFRKRASTGALKTRQGSLDFNTQSDTTDFEEGPWITAMDYLERGAPKNLPRVTIASIKNVSRSSGHISELVAMVKAVVPNGFGDVSAILKDPTGAINGCIHRSVLTESKYSQRVVPGAVLVLHKVVVFSSSPYAHYLNIISENVHKLFAREVGSFQPPASVNDDKNVEENEVKSLEVTPDNLRDRSQDLATISQRRRDPPRAGRSFQNNECVPSLGENQRSGQSRCGESIERLPDDLFPNTRGRHSEVAEGDSRIKEKLAKNSRQLPNTQTTKDLDGKATREEVAAAKAKAAGWDFGEDVEVLLDDYPMYLITE
ncbi:hypothetical protein R1flu_001174 [Riccia fluitans]|uniref:Homologous recombination OB-fold protein OB-fold domain-containing protein n=1 Tax=Riccia fluitans TaxID=41844 RepID=A0ABD1Y2I4_9MARC